MIPTTSFPERRAEKETGKEGRDGREGAEPDASVRDEDEKDEKVEKVEKASAADATETTAVQKTDNESTSEINKEDANANVVVIAAVVVDYTTIKEAAIAEVGAGVIAEAIVGVEVLVGVTAAI